VSSSTNSIDGLLIVDKPRGWTSHDVVAKVRRLTGERRTGHAGTLDPLATGVLVLGVGQGTRVLTYLMESRKAYRAVARLGQTTDTSAAEGEVVVESSIAGVTVEAVEAALTPYRGPFEQRPPIYSAIKLAGRPLYKYARAGIDVETAPRRVQVDSLILTQFEPPLVRLEIECSAGFYVRSLAHDLGQALGCGAHLTELRRVRAGPFTEEDAVGLADLESAAAEGRLADYLRPLDTPLMRAPALILAEAHTTDIVQGKALVLTTGPTPPANTLCRAYSTAGELIGVLKLDGQGAARPLRIFPEGRRGPNIVNIYAERVTPLASGRL
jgi:tRNA pseudouridine55 synthase